MIRVHRAEGGEGGWVSVVAPTAEEREQLVREHGVPAEMVVHSLDPFELPRVHGDRQALLLVVRVPVVATAGDDAPWVTSPLGLVLLKDRVVTIAVRESEVLERLRSFADAEWAPNVRHRLVLHALEVTADAYLAQLRRIDELVDRLEDRLDRSLENREVRELLKCQKSLAYFTGALSGLALVLETLQSSPEVEIPKEDHGLLRDTLIEVRQALEMTNLSSGVLSNMMDAFASMISNNLNVVMKFFAAMSLVLTFPILVASYWGMNVPLPLARSPGGVWWLIGGSLGFSAVVAAILRRRGWL